MSWFKTVSANLNMRVKCKALFACCKAASVMITEEWCNVEEQTGVIHGPLDTRRVEYCAEMADIRVVCPHRGATSSKPVDHKTGDQQGQLNDLWSNRDLQNRHQNMVKGRQMCIKLEKIRDLSNCGIELKLGSLTNKLERVQRRLWDCRNTRIAGGQKESCWGGWVYHKPRGRGRLGCRCNTPPCPLAPGWKDLVSQLNQDPRAESIADSGIGDTAVEEDVESTVVKEEIELTVVKEEIKLNAVREESVEDETSYAFLDRSSGPDDLTWNIEIPYLEILDDSTTVCKTPVASSTPATTPTVDAMLSPTESPGNKKPWWETMAERLLKSTEIREPDYNDAPLVGKTRPDLSQVIPWICFKAQSMMEPPWQMEFAKIKQDDDV